MTPQEEQLLNSLIERVNQTQLQEKDPDAEALINQKLGPNPDALYMLAQTVLVQNIALDQAKAQIGQLQQQVQQQQRPQPAHTTSFLGRLLGEHDQVPQQQQAPAPAYQPVPQYAAPQAQRPVRGAAASIRKRSMCLWAGSRVFCAAPCRRRQALRREHWRLRAWSRSFTDLDTEALVARVMGWAALAWASVPSKRPSSTTTTMTNRGAAASMVNIICRSSTGYDPRNNDPNDNLRGFDDQNASPSGDQDTSAFADASSLDDPAAYDDQNVDDGSGPTTLAASTMAAGVSMMAEAVLEMLL